MIVQIFYKLSLNLLHKSTYTLNKLSTWWRHKLAGACLFHLFTLREFSTYRSKNCPKQFKIDFFKSSKWKLFYDWVTRQRTITVFHLNGISQFLQTLLVRGYDGFGSLFSSSYCKDFVILVLLNLCYRILNFWQQQVVLRKTLTLPTPKNLQQTFVLHTQNSASFVLSTQKSVPKSRSKKAARKAAK